jgi:hypothetical protein
MQDFLVTIIVAWILFRLFRPVVFVQWNKPQKHYHNYYSDSQNHTGEGEIKVTRPPQNKQSDNSGQGGEYVDFEELPK